MQIFQPDDLVSEFKQRELETSENGPVLAIAPPDELGGADDTGDGDDDDDDDNSNEGDDAEEETDDDYDDDDEQDSSAKTSKLPPVTKDVAQPKKKKKKVKEHSDPLGLKDPPDAIWLPLTVRRPGQPIKQMGEVLFSVELLPKVLAAKRPAGYGRSGPNENPTLPDPVGRPDLDPMKMLNPLYWLRLVLSTLVTPELLGAILVVAMLAALFFGGPCA